MESPLKYEAEDTSGDKKTTVGTMMIGAPTKEHRLLEYFLVISYGKDLKIRIPSASLEIFENHQKAEEIRKELRTKLKKNYQKYKLQQNKKLNNNNMKRRNSIEKNTLKTKKKENENEIKEDKIESKENKDELSKEVDNS